MIFTSTNKTEKVNIDTIYIKYRNLMYKAAYEILEDKSLSEDAVFEAMTAILKYKDKLENKTQIHIKNYVIRVCKNTAKKMKKHPDYITYETSKVIKQDCFYINPEDIVIEKDSYNKMKAVLKDMNPKYRDVINYKYADELSIRQISEIMGISCDAVKKRLQRGVHMMAETLRKEGY